MLHHYKLGKADSYGKSLHAGLHSLLRFPIDFIGELFSFLKFAVMSLLGGVIFLFMVLARLTVIPILGLLGFIRFAGEISDNETNKQVLAHINAISKAQIDEMDNYQLPITLEMLKSSRKVYTDELIPMLKDKSNVNDILAEFDRRIEYVECRLNGKC